MIGHQTASSYPLPAATLQRRPEDWLRQRRCLSPFELRVERFIGTVKLELASAPIADGNALVTALQDIRQWYNHEQPHDHLQGRTPAEV